MEGKDGKIEKRCFSGRPHMAPTAAAQMSRQGRSAGAVAHRQRHAQQHRHRQDEYEVIRTGMGSASKRWPGAPCQCRCCTYSSCAVQPWHSGLRSLMPTSAMCSQLLPPPVLVVLLLPLPAATSATACPLPLVPAPWLHPFRINAACLPSGWQRLPGCRAPWGEPSAGGPYFCGSGGTPPSQSKTSR